MLNLNQQVTSLEISKRLKELNCKQESLFCWVEDISPNKDEFYLIQYPTEKLVRENYSAFTVAELGEMLPVTIIDSDLYEYHPEIKKDRTITTKKVFWSCLYLGEETALTRTDADTEADARGKMLIYLLENKHITL